MINAPYLIKQSMINDRELANDDNKRLKGQNVSAERHVIMPIKKRPIGK